MESHPLAELEVSREMLGLVAAIDEFKGRWSAIGNLVPERLSALKKVATIESIASSTRIEGVTLSDQEVDALLGGAQVYSFRTRDAQEVAGYAAVMEVIFDSWRHIPITENHIKQLHGVLLKHSAKDQHHRGHYKTVPNHLEAFDPAGVSLGVVFRTATPFETPGRMERLVRWTAATLATEAEHPRLVIAWFVVEFLAIHPFKDGNGRLSRALTTLLLLKAGYEYVPYSSLERVVEDNKDAYYRALRVAQTTVGTPDARLHEWVLFFLTCLDVQKNVLAGKLEREKVFGALPELAERILAIAREHGRITTRDAVALTGAPRPTVKAQIRLLVEARKLARFGVGRGTWYQPEAY